MIKQRYCLKKGQYQRCCDEEPMNQEHCPDRQQKLVKDKLTKLELVLSEGLRKKKCVCKFLKVLGIIILVLSAVAVFIALGVVGHRGHRHHGRHHRGHHDHHGRRYSSEQESEDDFQNFQQNNDDIKDVTEQSAAEPISKGTMNGDQIFDMYDEMYRQKMADSPKLGGYHLFYINCTTSNKKKEDYSWDQHCQLKDWKHPNWNKLDDEQSSSSMQSNQSSESNHIEESMQDEEPDKDFLQSAEEKPVEGRRLEQKSTEKKDDVSEEDQFDGITEEEKQALLEDVSCRRRGHCRKNKIAYIIDNHCFILSRPQKHHRRHHGHPGFCPYIALLRTIHLLVTVWVIVFVVACCKHRCHKKKMRKLFRKLVKIENRDGSNCHMMMHRGIREIEFHIKTEETRVPPRFNYPIHQVQQQMPQPQQIKQPTQTLPQQSTNYYRVDLRNERPQDESMVSRNEQYRV